MDCRPPGAPQDAERGARPGASLADVRGAMTCARKGPASRRSGRCGRAGPLSASCPRGPFRSLGR